MGASKFENQVTTMLTKTAAVDSTTKKQHQVSMRLLTAKCKQQQKNRDEIYDHFEYDRALCQDQDRNSVVAEFYRDKSVFITGASGFVGKCLLEKILRSCPNIGNIYILMRSKRGVEIEERIKQLLDSELFARIRQMPNSERMLKKIKPIRGDITAPLFGISESDVELLCSEVSLAFHSAATIKFVEPLKVALTNNVISVGNLIELASKLKKLEALVHVSTAYSNCDRKNVDEVFYEPPIEPERLIEMARWMDAGMFENIAPILVGLRPNTYTFTKAVAEALLVKRSRELIPNVPIAMVRPSIVAGTWQQPLKGWVDNFNGPTGVILSMATGALQAMPAYSDYCADIVPVDIVANLLVCAAYQVKSESEEKKKKTQLNIMEVEKEEAEMSRLPENIKIFNCVSGTLNPICWDDIVRCVKHISKQFPMNNPFRDPGFILMSNEHLFSVFNFFSHRCVAYLGDFCLKLIGQKPSLVIIFSRLNKMVATLRPFTTNQWMFKCTNVTSLYESLPPVDKEIFNFDVRQVDWDDYIVRYYLGSKTFALKDDPNTLASARHKRRRMKTSNRMIQLLLLMAAYYFLVNGTALEQYLLRSIEFLVPSNPLDYLPGSWMGTVAEQSDLSAAATQELPLYRMNVATTASDPHRQMAASVVSG